MKKNWVENQQSIPDDYFSIDSIYSILNFWGNHQTGMAFVNVLSHWPSTLDTWLLWKVKAFDQVLSNIVLLLREIIWGCFYFIRHYIPQVSWPTVQRLKHAVTVTLYLLSSSIYRTCWIMVFLCTMWGAGKWPGRSLRWIPHWCICIGLFTVFSGSPSRRRDWYWNLFRWWLLSHQKEEKYYY